jgi:hypothetical protein
MKTFASSLSALLLLSGSALAQDVEKSPQAPSTIDKGATPNPGRDGKTTAPKTTGAMNRSTGGVATSPQDTHREQAGQEPAAAGGKDRVGALKKDPNKSRRENQTGK